MSSPQAEEAAKVLTLEAALANAESNHPDLLLAEAERDIAMADRDIAASRTDASVNLEGILRSGSRTRWTEDISPDNSARLVARKTLYDFGRTSAAVEAGKSELNAREADLLAARDRRRIEVMTRYFDVLLADMQYTADNELAAVIYVTFSNGQDSFKLGQLSSVELAGLESNFQNIAEKRNASSQRQRINRAMLANAMNRPGDLPGDLAEPKLEGNKRVLPEFEALQSLLLANNPRLQAQQELLRASQQRVESLRAEKGPTLDAEVQAADFSRSALTRDYLSAGLILSWPLYQGNRADSRVARELAQIHKLQAGLEKLKMELSQGMLETYLEIVQLQGVSRTAAQKQVDYRDLVMERSRGLYEMELKSNLGTSMVDTVEANLRARRVEYQLALNFARLEAMLGRTLEDNRTAIKPAEAKEKK
jgi:outer membrane protein TolC